MQVGDICGRFRSGKRTEAWRVAAGGQESYAGEEFAPVGHRRLEPPALPREGPVKSMAIAGDRISLVGNINNPVTLYSQGPEQVRCEVWKDLRAGVRRAIGHAHGQLEGDPARGRGLAHGPRGPRPLVSCPMNGLTMRKQKAEGGKQKAANPAPPPSAFCLPPSAFKGIRGTPH